MMEPDKLEVQGRKPKVKTRDLLCVMLAAVLFVGGCKDRADKKNRALLDAAEAGDGRGEDLLTRHGVPHGGPG